MGLFKKKKEVRANFIKLNEVESTVELKFKELSLYNEFKKIVKELNYHKDKLSKYNEVLGSREFEKRITQDRDYLDKSADKAYNIISDFLDKLSFPKSVLKIPEFAEKSTTLMEDFEKDVSKPLSNLKEVMPKLLERINIKIKSITDILAELNRYCQKEEIIALGKIKNLINEYYSLEDKKAELKNERIPLLDKLTQISMMKDRVEARLENLKKKRNMGNVVEMMKERDELEEDLKEKSSIIRVNVSYINESLDSKDDFFTDIIESNEIISREDYEKIRNKIEELDVENKDKIINELNQIEEEFLKLHDKYSKIIRRLKDNMTYMEIKEQEDAFNLWNEKFNDLREKIREIDEKRSDISLDFVIQKLNKEIQKITPNTIIEKPKKE